jgi:hypothetical protein
MSKHETELTIRYWQSVGGTLVEEFPAVHRGKDHAQRLIDGVIVLDGQRRRARAADVDIRDKDIVVVQTKAGRLGMYLMGQALFSKELMHAFGPRSIKTVAVCIASDSVLKPLCEKYGIEVVVFAT